MAPPSSDLPIQPLILYDLDSMLPVKTWSFNVWRARFALNIKKIPYRTEWVDLADVTLVCKELGAAPTDKRDDGTPIYTIPVIIDPNTNRIVSDSLRIVEYLDLQYPETIPLLHVPGTRQSLAFLQGGLLAGTAELIRPFYILNVPKEGEISPRSRNHLAGAFKRFYGFETLPTRESKDWNSAWVQAEKNLSVIASWYHKYGSGDSAKWVFGDGPTFVDLGIAGVMIWTRDTFGRESKEWKTIASWDGGRWARLLENLDEYTTVV